jgi:diaminopimelate decarboxylase
MNRVSVQDFALVAARAVKFARAYARYADAEIRWVDLGGGFADPAATPIEAVTWNPPPVEEFIRAALAVVGDWERPPVLMFEPGRALVGCSVDLYTRVESVKTVAGIQVVTVDAGINSLPFARFFSYPVEVSPDHGGQQVQTTICGPLCMSDDVLRDAVMLPPLQKGALLKVRGVGAYNLGMSFDFTRPRAGVCIRHGARVAHAKRLFGDSNC